MGEKPASRLAVVRSRAFWAIAIPRFLAEPAWQTFNFFIPLYLVAVWDVNLAGIAAMAWLPSWPPISVRLPQAYCPRS